MTLLNPAYRLKAQSGQSNPVDEQGGGTLTGATQTLVDRGSGDWAWQFSAGQSNCALPAHTIDFATATSGITVAMTIKVTNYGSQDYEVFVGVDSDPLPGGYGQFPSGLYIGKTASGVLRGAGLGAANLFTPTTTVSTSTERTIVFKLYVNAASGVYDRMDIWLDGGSGSTADVTSGSYNLSGSLAVDTLVVNAQHSSVVQLKDLVVWNEEISDANCRSVATNLRGVLDVDTTPPVLSSPTGTATGSTTGTIGATTNEGNGVLYGVVTTSATQPTKAQIKAGQNASGGAANWAGSVAVSSTGAKTLNASGLAASTGYYGHLFQEDTALNQSNAVSSGNWTTNAPGDTTPPTLPGPITPSAITQTSFTLSWPTATDNVAVTGYETSLDGGSTYVDQGNVTTKNFTGQSVGTTYPTRVRAYDAAGNRSSALSLNVTTLGGLLTVGPFENNTTSVLTGLTGLIAVVMNIADMSVAKTFTAMTTNGSGMMALQDPLIIQGSEYVVAVKNASKVLGIEKYTAT